MRLREESHIKMIVKEYVEMLGRKSAIRELFDYGAERAKQIGYENVFDYSLGNPSVAVPRKFNETLAELALSGEDLAVHGYSPSLGIPSVRQAVAEHLRKRFSLPYEAKHIFMATGAAGALAHAIRAVAEPGSEVVVIAPYFPEYDLYITGAGCVARVVPAREEDFQVDFAALEERISSRTSAVLINTPNNPSGAVYSAETMVKLADLLEVKQREVGHPIFLISDEPYREIVFQGVDCPYAARFYENTITCYSFSKSLSLPGERIGYMAVNPGCQYAELIPEMCAQISRGTGHNCPPSIIQLAVAQVLDETADLSVYETNKNILYPALTQMGFSCVEPGGTFYMFPKAPDGDGLALSQKAKEFDLLLVPGGGFGCPGHFRISYCIDTEKVHRSLSAFQKLADHYFG